MNTLFRCWQTDLSVFPYSYVEATKQHNCGDKHVYLIVCFAITAGMCYQSEVVEAGVRDSHVTASPQAHSFTRFIILQHTLDFVNVEFTWHLGAIVKKENK